MRPPKETDRPLPTVETDPYLRQLDRALRGFLAYYEADQARQSGTPTPDSESLFASCPPCVCCGRVECPGLCVIEPI